MGYPAKMIPVELNTFADLSAVRSTDEENENSRKECDMARVNDPLTQVGTRGLRSSTPQNRPASGPESERQVRNNAGGYVFKVDDEARLLRFLTLGVDGGTYYVSQGDLTRENSAFVLDLVRRNGKLVVDTVLAVSEAGRAPKQNATLFTLAVAAKTGSKETRTRAYEVLPRVARTGTMLFQFIGYCEQFGGWGQGMMKAVSRWYTSADVNRVAYQAIKYRQRHGWSQRDVLRKAHPGRWSVALSAEQHALLNWIATGTVDESRAPGRDHVNREVGATYGDLPAIVTSFQLAQHPGADVKTWVGEIKSQNLPWEALPDAALKEKRVWRAMIANGMPIGALIRQLPRLTNLGLFEDSEVVEIVARQLTDAAALKKGRIHPINQLIALRTYASGHSLRGDNRWTPHPRIIDALDKSFYLAYGSVEPAGKKTLVALDVSGSMGGHSILDPSVGGRPGQRQVLPITPREIGAALSLVFLNVETDVTVVGFTSGSRGSRTRYDGFSRYERGEKVDGNGISALNLSARQRLDDATRLVHDMNFGGTDVALPALWAIETQRYFDTIVTITDNETWAGDVQPQEALAELRRVSGKSVRQVSIATSATDYTVNDSNDPHCLDVAGFDSAIPNIVSDFSARRI